MSFFGSWATTSAGERDPSAKVTVMLLASAITWRLVSMSPAALITTPLPTPCSVPLSPSGLGRSIWTRTTDGRTA
jgi:hypothetical protein